MFGINYIIDEWSLFIGSCKRSLKAVLLNKRNTFASVHIGHSTHLKENYENLELVPTITKYAEDMKVLSMLLGQAGWM